MSHEFGKPGMVEHEEQGLIGTQSGTRVSLIFALFSGEKSDDFFGARILLLVSQKAKGEIYR